MTKRCNINDVRKEFEEEGYTLLTDTYKNAHTKLEYLCSNGHKSFTTYSNWHFGKRRCKYCSNQAPVTYDGIKEAFEKEGYTLLTKEYKNGNSLLTYVCPNGHETTSKWVNWSHGSRCRRCFADRTMIPFEQVKASFEKEGYYLVSTIYKGSGHKLDVVCPIGHSYSVSYSNWKAGYRCPVCGVIKNSGLTHYNWQGGLSFEPYCQIWKDKEYKNDIKERDGHQCLNPYCEGKEGHAGKLVIHHINYNKKDCSPNNLITVCGHCNIKANTDREWHESWYKAIMLKRYNRGSM